MMRPTWTLLAAAGSLLAGAALADLPDPPDQWTEFPDAAAAAAAGWFIECGLSQQLCVDADCACGETAVGCRSLRAYWSNRFGFAHPVPLSGLQAVRFQQRCTWTGFDALPWHVYLTMQPTPQELAAGIDLKQLLWTYPKAEEWTETTLAVAEAAWQWRDAESGMWVSVTEDGSTQLTEMVAIAWYQNIPFGLAIGEQKLIDALTFVITGTAAPAGAPPGARIATIFPNPANPAATVAVDVPASGDVAVQVLDARGRAVRTLHRGWLDAGRHRWRWQGRDAAGRPLPSGVYLVRVTGPWTAASGRLMLVR